MCEAQRQMLSFNDLARVSTRHFSSEDSIEVMDTIGALFKYAPWTPEQIEDGTLVRDSLESAFKVILDRVPPGPTRTTALRKLLEVRMDCNAAITFQGKI